LHVPPEIGNEAPSMWRLAAVGADAMRRRTPCASLPRPCRLRLGARCTCPLPGFYSIISSELDCTRCDMPLFWRLVSTSCGLQRSSGASGYDPQRNPVPTLVAAAAKAGRASRGENGADAQTSSPVRIASRAERGVLTLGLQLATQVAQFKATVLLMPNGSDRVTTTSLAQKLETDKKARPS